jgi:sensor domain CHASE-containing protein
MILFVSLVVLDILSKRKKKVINEKKLKQQFYQTLVKIRTIIHKNIN